MKPAPFDYHRPSSVEEMIGLLAEHGEDGKVLAGGQSLVPAMNFRLARPSVLLDANGLGELAFVSREAGVLRIGAMVRHAVFHRPVADTPMGRLLSQTVHYIAHYPIRQRGTFGGSLAHADPASEWCLLAATFDAEMLVRSKAGTRSVGAGAFFQGTFSTDLAIDDLLVEVRLPALDDGWRTGFYEFSRRAGDFALAMACAGLRIGSDGRIEQARLGVGAVSGRPVRLGSLEGDMVGQAPSPTLFKRIGEAARDLVDPGEDIHATVDYRRDLVGVVVARALARAVP